MRGLYCCLLLLAFFEGVWCQTTNASANASDQTTVVASTALPTVPTTNPVNPTAAARNASHDEEREIEYEPYDGWYNNRANPDWGAIDSILIRLLPPAYSDGVYEPSGPNRPNPFEISEAVFSGTTGFPSFKNRSAFLVFFGQQVVEEMLDAQRPGCPPEYFNIKIPKNHTFNPEGRDELYMPLLRSRYNMRTGLSPNNPRQQINEITPYLDGGLVYGASKAWADTLRLFKRGRLAATNDTDSPTGGYSPNENGHFPAINEVRLPMANPPPPADHYLKPVSRFFKLGNPRGNENPFLLTFGVMWFRFHNVMAERIYASHNNWSDEKIFNEARKWVIAIYQKLVLYDWLPRWIQGERYNETVGPYKKYDPTTHPGISHVFQSAAMRFGHTLVPPGILRRKKPSEGCLFKMHAFMKADGTKGHTYGLRTCNSYWNPQDAVRETDIAEIIMGISSQVTEREDNIVTPDLRGNVFGGLDFSRRDLMAVNIQRARDHGLPDYNTARKEFGLEAITKDTWYKINEKNCNADLTDKNPKDGYSCEPIRRLKAVYNDNPDGVDIWPGGLLETTSDGPGPLFSSIILDQFRRVRDGDRFWFENYELNGLFTKDEVNEIRGWTVKKVVMATTNITDEDIQDDPFFATGSPCFQEIQLNETQMEDCTPLKHYDYFTNSDASFIISFSALGAFAIGTAGVLYLMAKRHQKEGEKLRRAQRKKSVKKSVTEDTSAAIEWIGKKEGERNILLKFDDHRKQILVRSSQNKPIRTIDLSHTNEVTITLSTDKRINFLLLHVPKESYDLVLKFDNTHHRQQFHDKLIGYLGNIGIGQQQNVKKEEEIFKTAKTKAKRQKLLDRFFRIIFAHAFNIKGFEEEVQMVSAEAQDIITCELTKTEFAESLSMKSNSTFVEQMFALVDKDNSGYISFREFLDLIVIFAKGDADAKAKLMFDMYDIENKGCMSREDFKNMLKSLMELANTSLQPDQMESLIDSMFKEAGLHNVKTIRYEQFKQILADYKDALSYSQLNWQGADIPDAAKPDKVAAHKKENVQLRARKTIVNALRSEQDERHGVQLKRISTHLGGHLQVRTINRPKVEHTSWLSKKWMAIVRYLENYRMHIFWLCLYTLVTLGIFMERAYYYSVEREHSGLRRIAGYGVTVTRGAASGMMWTYSCLLVTMSRNIITFLRETFLHRFIPFDSNIFMHKYVAAWALLFTIMHCVGHAINFYHVSTQTPSDVACLFRNYFRATHELPSFHYWCWQTITGLTGVFATCVVIVMYTFAIQYSRRHAFKAFWITHHLYIVLYILIILHGSGMLVQPAFFYYFFLGPAILFTLDKLVSISRKKVEIAVVKAELLPSDVTNLVFKRPLNFEYKSGQWVRIACLSIGEGEYHPFTLTSSPHEDNLSLHIRAVGPWTINLRKTYDPAVLGEHAYPKLYLDGPFGEGHQDWYKYDIAVLVGGGIGVTPFASILKDIVNKSQTGTKFNCKKVYFIWVTRTQKQFEWLTEIIREVEENDKKDLVSVHIFITQFYSKFDLRTTMLYICERHFQKISNRSLFTGLRSITHFGRPDFPSFLDSLQDEHPDVSRIGVFSCGPPPMTRNVENACSDLNKVEGASFLHHFENF